MFFVLFLNMCVALLFKDFFLHLYYNQTIFAVFQGQGKSLQKQSLGLHAQINCFSHERTTFMKAAYINICPCNA